MKTNKLKEIRVLKGLTQENIAFELGISQKAYSDIENGKVCIKTEKLKKITEILEIGPSEICLNACECDLNNDVFKKIENYMIRENIKIPNILKNKLKLKD
jgi:transcriptional regulator with XRE-family HTH domain